MNRIAWLSLLTLICVAAGCGGGGGGGGGAQQPAVAGVLSVPANNKVEIEPNNTLAQAQRLAAGDSVSGAVNETESGFSVSSGVIQDLYQVTLGQSAQISLTMADDTRTVAGDPASPLKNDIDLFLLDAAGNVLKVSEGENSLEETISAAPGTYLVGVRGFAGASPYLLSIATATTTGAAEQGILTPGAEIVPGEVLMKPKEQAKAHALAASHGVTHAAAFAQGVRLLKLALPQKRTIQSASGNRKANIPGEERNELIAATIAKIRELRGDPDVEYAEPNFVRHTMFVPNDEFYPFQWHYPAINLPQAWDITKGANAIVAVIDTGVLKGHPDLQGQIVGGFDFISDAGRSGDGDGIDPDANDVGDGTATRPSSFHGTHVSGTIAALTNNNTGVAGIAFEAKIMPLRVLGQGGGTDADIAQAIRFAAGLPNDSGTVPPRKADVINMSLGGPGCSQTLHDAVIAARNQGVIIAAAAGNSNSSAPECPGAFPEVVSVAAVGLDLTKAPYSNFGPNVKVAAPGGNTSVDLNGDNRPDGVLSTIGDDSGKFFYKFAQGTSMATPHMAGVLALMRSVNPALTPNDVDLLLAGTHPLTQARITTDLGAPGRDDIFGNGLIDASKAVTVAKSIAGSPPVPRGPVLAVSPASLDFDSQTTTIPLSVTNGGDGTLTIASVAANQPWLKVSPVSGAANLRVDVTVDRTSLAAGPYNGAVLITTDAASGAQSKTVSVTMQVGVGATTGDVGTIFVLAIDPSSGKTVAQAETTAKDGYRYRMAQLPPGQYRLAAGTDRDNDNLICDNEDACGSFPNLVTVAAGTSQQNINFVVSNFTTKPQALSNTGGVRELRRLSTGSPVK